MTVQYKQDAQNSNTLKKVLLSLTLITPYVAFIPQVFSAEVYSVHVDRDNQKLIVKGDDFLPSTAVTLGGIVVNTDNVTPTELDVPFAAAVYLAVQWEGSYNMVIDGNVRISVYIDGPILAPPPPGGPDCPCIAGWEAANVYPDSYLCLYGTDGTQSYIFGNNYSGSFVSSAFDPNKIFYDPVNPGNSISFCALVENNNYTVSEPVVNEDQYNDCYDWMWINACL